MPPFDLPEQLLNRLQHLPITVPLVDTVPTVIEKLVDYYEAAHKAKPNPPPRGDGVTQSTSDAPPDLTHTKLLSARIAGSSVDRPNWNALLFEMIRRTKSHLQVSNDPGSLIVANFVKGKKEDEGYKYLPEVGLSIQGQDANSAWRAVSHISRKLGLPVDVVFMWRHKREAAYPGETSSLKA